MFQIWSLCDFKMLSLAGRYGRAGHTWHSACCIKKVSIQEDMTALGAPPHKRIEKTKGPVCLAFLLSKIPSRKRPILLTQGHLFIRPDNAILDPAPCLVFIKALLSISRVVKVDSSSRCLSLDESAETPAAETGQSDMQNVSLGCMSRLAVYRSTTPCRTAWCN